MKNRLYRHYYTVIVYKYRITENGLFILGTRFGYVFLKCIFVVIIHDTILTRHTRDHCLTHGGDRSRACRCDVVN